MPYIKEERKKELNLFARQISVIEDIGENCSTVGDLNYTITKVLKGYLQEQGESYGTYNDIIGVLECAKLEMYRRKVSVYEDKKIKENGDVY